MSRYHNFFHALLSFFAIVVLLLAILLSLARTLTPLLNEHKSWFENTAARFVGEPVQIDSIDASFNGLLPEFAFHDVSILSSKTNKTLFKIRQLNIGINLLQSAWQRQLVANYITIEGTSIEIERNADGQIDLNGEMLNVNTQSSTNLSKDSWLSPEGVSVLAWILEQQRISLKDIALHWVRPGKADVRIPDLHLILLNQGGHHYLRGSASLLSKNHVRLVVSMDLKGDIRQRHSLNGAFYWQGENLPLAVWFRHVFPQLTINQAHSTIKMWINIKQGHFDTIKSVFNFTDLKLNTANQSIPVTEFGGDLFWQRQTEQSWSLATQELHWNNGERQWALRDFAATIDSAAPSQSFSLKYLDLAELGSWLTANTWLPPKLAELWKSYQPQGQLSDIMLLHNGDWQDLAKQSSHDILKNTYARSSFNQLSINSVNHQPAITKLTGSFIFQPEKGSLQIDSHQGLITLPALFPVPIAFTQLQGQILWQRNEKSWQVTIPDFQFTNPILSLAAQMQLVLADKKKNNRIDLVATFSQQGADKIKTLLPTKVMHEGLIKWLSDAFIAGEGETGMVVMRGKLADFPYSKQQGQFIATAHIKNMTLDYAEGWPYLYQLNGDLRFDPIGMHFVVSSGIVIGKPIQNTTAEIPGVLSGDAQVVNVNTQVAMDVSDALHFIKVSPLHETLSGLSEMQGNGITQLKLGLGIPLEGDVSKHIKVDGNLALSDDTFSFPGWNIALEQANGLLHFTQDGIWSKNLQAHFFQQPATFNIKTIAGKNSITRFTVDSKIAITELSNHFNLPNSGMLQGVATYHGTLDLHNKSASDKLHISSDLQGVAINLPPPYGKSKQQQSAVTVEADFSKQATQLKFNYAGKITGNIWLEKINGSTGLQRGVFNFGEPVPALPTQPGILITGYLADFDWAVWQPYVQKYRPIPSATSNPVSKPTASDKTMKSPNDQYSLFRLLDLKVGKISAYNQTVTNAEVQVQHSHNAWQAKISSDSMDGTVTIPDSFPQQALVANFKRAYLQPWPLSETSADKKNVAEKPIGENTFKPTDIPPLQLNIDDLKYGERDFDTVKLGIVHLVDGVKVNTLSIKSPLIDLEVNGSWTQKDKKNNTAVAGTATFSNLGGALKSWGVTDKILKGKGTLAFQLAWPDRPEDIDVAKLAGTAKLNINNGLITGLDESTNAKLDVGKLLNLLSMDTILQRLSLNFSDITHKGYSFDHWTGNYQIDAGKVATNNTDIKGTVAEISSQGSINLVTKTYDLKVKIVPHLTSSIPLIAAVFGGPIIGAAAFAADFIVSPGVDKITAQNYVVTGSWDNPQIEKAK